jgi:hypothetical protein
MCNLKVGNYVVIYDIIPNALTPIVGIILCLAFVTFETMTTLVSTIIKCKHGTKYFEK